MARYTDSLLVEGEHVLYRTRQHPLGRITAERVLPRPVQDVLSLHEQRVGVARHPSSLLDRGRQARGCARAYTSRTRSPVRCV